MNEKTRGYIRTGFGILLLTVMLFPLYWMVNASLQPSGNTLSSSWFPLSPTLANYRVAISEQGANLGTSLIIATGTVILSIGVATPAAYALAKFKFSWIQVALLLIMVTQMIPGIVIANGLYSFYEGIGLLNSIPGLILANATAAIPFAILIMRSFMIGIPPSIIEAARVDGAGQFRAFFSVVVPIARNSLITAGLFSFLFAWSDFLFALTLTTKDGMRPVTLGIYQYLGAQVQSWGAVMATSVMSALPAIVLLIVAQKYIAAGATGGAVKS
ncbi:MAG: carbohydrate ABC transporter permease [Propioniciclava sp.]